jgi:hypothetical protein
MQLCLFVEYPFGVLCCVWFHLGKSLKVEVIKDEVLFQSIVRLATKG